MTNKEPATRDFISWVDFIDICEIDDTEDFFWGLRVDKDGVWVRDISNHRSLSIQELAAIRPRSGWDRPMLSFPCSPEELRKFLEDNDLDEYMENLDFLLPEGLKEPIGENENISAELTEEASESISGKERQELGRLKQERGKWENAIKAAVDVAHTINEKITRNDLKDKIYKYDLPDSTIEILWQALREKGLTKGAGRPKNKK